MKEWRPQVLTGILLLTAIAGAAMWLGFEEIAAACAGGIVSCVTILSQNGR